MDTDHRSENAARNRSRTRGAYWPCYSSSRRSTTPIARRFRLLRRRSKAFGLSPVEMATSSRPSPGLRHCPGSRWLVARSLRLQDHLLLQHLLLVRVYGHAGLDRLSDRRRGGRGTVHAALALGAAESPSFPGNSRITSAWFPSSAHWRRLSSIRHNTSPLSCSHRSWAGSCIPMDGRVFSSSWARWASF